MIKAVLADGRVLAFPAGTSPEVVQSTVKQFLVSGMPDSAMAANAAPDPTEGMSGFDLAAAGAGKAFVDMYRGGRQLLGVASQDEINEAKRLDAPLMNTGAGVAGNVVGNVAASIPAAMIPGANTVAGGALIGAGMSALQPVSSDDSRAYNIASGGVMGAALPAVGQLLKGVRAGVVDPIRGRDRIIAGAIRRNVGDDQVAGLAQALRNADGAATPGVTLSAGTLTGNEGLAAIEDGLRTQMPNGALARQSQVNRNVLSETLRNIGQDDVALAAAKAARSRTTGPLYERAGVDFVEPTDQLKSLLERPAAKSAWERAQRIAANEGEKIVLGDADSQMFSVNGLHYLKMGIDDLLGDSSSGIGKAEMSAIKSLRDQLLSEIDSLSPSYSAARSQFAELSRPVNQMQVGQSLANKLIPATADENPATLNYASLAKALRNPDEIAKKATKFDGARMDTVFDADQLQSIQGVNKDGSRIAEALKRGAGLGSPTARRLAQSNLLGEHFLEQSPVAAFLLGGAERIPVIGSAVKGLEAGGSLLGRSTNQALVERLDDLLATNPQQLAALLSDELARMNPQQRNAVIRALPQSVMMALPRIDTE